VIVHAEEQRKTTANTRVRSTLVDQLVLGDWLLVVVPPGREVRVVVRLGVLVDVGRGWEIGGVASNVDRVLGLIDADVVDSHLRWEGEMVKVNAAEALGQAQVRNQVHRLLRYRPCGDVHAIVRSRAGGEHCPRRHALRHPGDVL
jgi:hypothetical protein